MLGLNSQQTANEKERGKQDNTKYFVRKTGMLRGVIAVLLIFKRVLDVSPETIIIVVINLLAV